MSEPANLRMPPYSADAEHSVIGSAMMDGTFPLSARKLDPEDFYRRVNRQIWRGCFMVDSEGGAIDPVVVAERLERDGLSSDELGEINRTLRYTCELHAGSSTLEAWVNVVVDKARERNMIAALNSASDAIWGEGLAAEKIDKAQSLVMDTMTDKREGGPEIVQDVLRRVVDDVESRRTNGTGLRGVTTGFRDLDKRTAGLPGGDLIVLAARPSMGKTTLALNVAASVAKAGDPVMIFSLEMSAEQCAAKIAASLGKAPMWGFQSPEKLKGEHWGHLISGVAQARKLPIHIEDNGMLGVMGLRQAARLQHAQTPLGLIVIDYLQLMHGEGNNANEKVSLITRQLKNLARELNVPVLLLSQLNRNLENRNNKRPTNADLRDSGSIEQDADMIWFIYRDEVYNPNTSRHGVAELITSKFRMGQIGTDYLTSELQYSRFVDMQGDLPPEDAYEDTWDRGFD